MNLKCPHCQSFNIEVFEYSENKKFIQCVCGFCEIIDKDQEKILKKSSELTENELVQLKWYILKNRGDYYGNIDAFYRKESNILSWINSKINKGSNEKM